CSDRCSFARLCPLPTNTLRQQQAFEDMRVVDLKVELKARGLPVSGLKAVLIQRLHDHDNSLVEKLAQAKDDEEP
ncbi:unnamed protein product, partial [Ectocarpus sp. 13 AM-2016]